MSIWFDQLVTSLAAAGVETRVWPAGAGRLLLTVSAARILACELPGVEGNLFWHSPALLKPPFNFKSAVGGDRLWLGPEIAYMWMDLKQARIDAAKTNTLDPQMDPGGWQVEAEREGLLRLTTSMSLTDHRTRRRIDLDVTRQFSLAAAPQGLPPSVRAFAFTIENSATLGGGDDGAVASLWDLLQLPARGTLVCPIAKPVTAPRSYYSPFGEKHVQVDSRAVRFLIDGRRQIKMGLPPEVTNGRMGYHRPIGDGACFIFRTFTPQPREPYVDLPRDSDETFGGDCLQAYNDDGRFGGFGEMEYHEPAVVAGRSPVTRTGRCETCVMHGPGGEVLAVAERLLGVPVNPL